MTNRLEMFLATREDARRRGDWGVSKAMESELARLGYTEQLETTQAAPMPERAVPAKPKPRRGRPPKPRCEHGMILDRCPDCKTEGV